MEATDQLTLIAELGVGFAGFLAIFLVFARREGKFSPADGLRVRVILEVSFLTIFLALLPLVLALSELQPTTVWKGSSLIQVGVALYLSVAIGRRQVALRPEDRAELGLASRIGGWGLGGSALLLGVANAGEIFGAPSGLLYVAALACYLGIASTNFLTLAFQRLL